MHDDEWTFTSMGTKIGSPTFHTWGLKSIQQTYNVHTYLSKIASNELAKGNRVFPLIHDVDNVD